MAPNNALANRKPLSGKTTVLSAGTVEGRGMGTNNNSRETIATEIQEFLNGEGKMSFTAETRAFFTVWTFITRLPGPTWVDHHPGYLMRGAAYFPLAGALVGIFVSHFFDLANITLGLPPIIAAAVSTASSFWVTGCFHEDGLADASDGIGGGWSRTQILRIMTDTRLGTYGCATLLLYVVSKLELLAALGPSEWDEFGKWKGAGPALVIAHTLSRLSSPYMIRTRDYVDEGGPKYQFYSFMLEAKHLVTWHRVTFALLSSLSITTMAYGIETALLLVIGVFVAGHLAGSYADYLLGGIMGDFLGATICMVELLVLSIILFSNQFPILLKQCVDKLSEAKDMENAQIVWTLLDEPRISALIRFLILVMITLLWCANVGHPDVLVRETAIKNSETNDNEIKISLSVPSDTNGDTSAGDEVTSSDDASSRGAVQKVCFSASSSFMERYDVVRKYLDTLAKPVGSLGALEDWAARIAALRRTDTPNLDKAACIIFAADHGVAADVDTGGEGCSLYPQSVTRNILEGLERGIAGASTLAKANLVDLHVVDVGVRGGSIVVDKGVGVVESSELKLVNGTVNYCVGPAMSTEESERCLRAGREAVKKHIIDVGAQILVLGEVGIGNTTTASVLLAALTGEDVDQLCDGGAYVSADADKKHINKKIGIVKKALKAHNISSRSASEILAKVGGAEIAALAGAILEASQHDVPVLLDGFIVTIAALVAAGLSPNACRVMLFATRSAEKGQAKALDAIYKISEGNGVPVSPPPALSMNLRMGEATGGILAVPIARSAVSILCDMATIQDILSK